MKLNLDVPEESSSDYEPLPIGWYQANVDSEETTYTQAGDEALKVSFSISGKGRTVNNWYNLKHSTSEQAREIATKELENLGRACGLANVKDSADLVGHSLEVKLEPDGTFNKVKGYRRAETATQRPPQNNGAAAEVPPWQRA